MIVKSCNHGILICLGLRRIEVLLLDFYWLGIKWWNVWSHQRTLIWYDLMVLKLFPGITSFHIIFSRSHFWIPYPAAMLLFSTRWPLLPRSKITTEMRGILGSMARVPECPRSSEIRRLWSAKNGRQRMSVDNSLWNSFSEWQDGAQQGNVTFVIKDPVPHLIIVSAYGDEQSNCLRGFY